MYNQVAGSTLIATDFLEEIRTFHLLHNHSHQNLAEFKVCLEKNNRVVGILLKRYVYTLLVRVEVYGQPPLDNNACFLGIEAGVKHLHSLGLAHNYLNPMNVMADEEDRPVIVDMGSCKPFEDELHQMGTTGWNEGFVDWSSANNDAIGLRKIKAWLRAGREEML